MRMHIFAVGAVGALLTFVSAGCAQRSPSYPEKATNQPAPGGPNQPSAGVGYDNPNRIGGNGAAMGTGGGPLARDDETAPKPSTPSTDDPSPGTKGVTGGANSGTGYDDPSMTPGTVDDPKKVH